MAINSIAHDEWEINRQLEVFDDLSENISKIKALTEIALNCETDNISEKGMKNYFWMIDSLADKIKISALKKKMLFE